MEEFFNGGQEGHEERSDYAANRESKTGYSSEGRKLRPRRKVSPAASSTADGEYKSYDNHGGWSGESRGRSEGFGQRRSYGDGAEGGERKTYGEGRPSYGRPSYGDRRPSGGFGQRRSFGEGAEGGERRSYGEGRPSYGRPSYGDRRPSGGFGQRRSFGDGAEGGERKSYGEGRPSYGRPSYGDRRPSGGFGQRRSFGEGAEGGERKSYGEGRPSYGHSSYGDRRPSGGFGQRRSFGEGAEGGERKSYGEGRPSYGHSSYGDRRPSGGFGQRRSFGEGAEGGERRTFGGKPGFKKNFGPSQGFGGKGQGRPGGKKFGYKKDYGFNDNDESRINQMLSRKPMVDDRAYSDNDNVPTPIKEEIRLNKYIANSGVCSRREADTFIQAGVVTVNGVVVTELGTKVNVINDDIRFNGEKLKGEKKVYIVMNKPKGFVTSASDPHAERTVMDLLKGCTQRVFPVGRLDKNTTGVLMFTNDGELAEKLTHPSYNKKKIYQVILDKALDEADKDKILNVGLDLGTTQIKADELEYIDAEDHRRLGIEIHSGENRIVRRIFESLGYDVKALDRVYFAGLTKKGLKKGEWRFLSEGESNILKMEAYV